MSASAARPRTWRSLIGPGIATLVAFAILIALGVWQLERKAWKEGLLAQIHARAYGPPGPVVSEPGWASWRADQDEFRHVRLEGTLLNDLAVPLHGLAKGPNGVAQGFYVFTPLRLAGGETVMINRGFVPVELRDTLKRPEANPSGPVTVTGLVRAPETRGSFVPANDPGRNEWFVRDISEMARARGLTRIAPFYVDADATPNPGGWPRGGQTQLMLPNDHLQYALTWFGLALALLGVFGTFAWHRLSGRESPAVAPPSHMPSKATPQA